METKDLLSYLGVDAENIETFKEQFQTKFVTKDQVPDEEKIKSSTIGKFTGAFKTKAKQLFELDSEELSKAERWEDILAMGVEKQRKQIEELKSMSVQTNDSVLKELNEKLEKANQMAKEYKQANEQIQNAFAEKENEWMGKYKGQRKQFEVKNALFGLKDKLSDTLSKADKFLLETEINSLQVDFADNEEIIVMDKEGKRLPNPKQVGKFLGLEEAIELIAEREGYLKKNTASTGTTFVAPKKEVQMVREIHPNALKNQ